MIARVGGDEFAVVLPPALLAAEAVARALCDAASRIVSPIEREVRTTLSIGRFRSAPA